MKFFPSNGNFSTHISSVDFQGLITEKKFNPGDKDRPPRGRNIDQK